MLEVECRRLRRPASWTFCLDRPLSPVARCPVVRWSVVGRLPSVVCPLFPLVIFALRSPLPGLNVEYWTLVVGCWMFCLVFLLPTSHLPPPPSSALCPLPSVLCPLSSVL